MEIESVQLSVEHDIHNIGETKKISWKWRLKALHESVDYASGLWGKQRKSPENGDWKKTSARTVIPSTSKETKKISWKWRLKGTHQKGPGKGSKGGETKKISWKWRLKVYIICFTNSVHPLRNKENLLKMEIESKMRASWIIATSKETKKISWKWRLKGFRDSLTMFACIAKQRKSPENGDWKLTLPFLKISNHFMKQRKSPENGDWKITSLTT